MKILMVTRRLYPDIIGGGQISALTISVALQKAGAEVSILTFTNNASTKEMLQGVRIYRQHLPPLKWIPWIANTELLYFQMGKIISRYIEKLNPDIVHALNIEAIPPVAWTAKIRRGIPIAATINAPMITSFPPSGIDRKGNVCHTTTFIERAKNVFHEYKHQVIYKRLLTPLILLYGTYYLSMMQFFTKKADAIFAVSKGIKEMLLENQFEERKVHVIHNPMPLPKKQKKNNNLKEKLDIHKETVLLYVGRLDRLKGIPQVIKTLKHLNNVIFIIVGKGVDELYLRKLAKQEGVEKKIRFIGHIPHEDTPEYYSIADIVVHPCLWFEPLSRMLLEASSYGIATVASERGGNTDIVINKKTGLIVKAGNQQELLSALKKLVSNKKLCKRLGNAARERIKKEFSLERIGSETIKIMNLLIDSNNNNIKKR